MKEENKNKKKSGDVESQKKKNKKKKESKEVVQVVLEEEPGEGAGELIGNEAAGEADGISEEILPEFPKMELANAASEKDFPENTETEQINVDSGMPGTDPDEKSVSSSTSPDTDYAVEDYMDELIQSKKLEAAPSMAQKRGQDERAMIREQERHAQARRAKRRRRRRNIIIAVIVVLLAAGVWFIGWGYSLIFGAGTDSSAVTIEVSEGQEIIYAQLTSVKGNEITYTIAEAVETAREDQETEGETPDDISDGEMPEGATEGEMPDDISDSEMPEGMSEGEMPEEMPEGEMPEEMPDGETSEGAVDGMEAPAEAGEERGTEAADDGQSSSAATSTATVLSAKISSATATAATVTSTDSYSMTSLGMGGMGGGGDMGGGDRGGGGGGSFDFGSFDFDSFGDSSSAVTSSASDTFTYDGVTYRLTEESATMQIPVGTDVTTRLGSVTTFASLSAGDCVALVVQEVDGEQVIMAVYIIG